MSNAITLPAQTGEIRKTNLEVPTRPKARSMSMVAGFDKIKHLLSDRPLRRANRTSPIPVVSNANLKKIAAENPPPAEWLDGEEECPF